MFTLLPARYRDVETTLDWMPDKNNLLVEMDQKKTANGDSYMPIKKGTDKGVTITAGFTDDEGQAWTISWDPIIIITDPGESSGGGS